MNNNNNNNNLDERQLLINESIYLLEKLNKQFNRDDLNRLKEIHQLLTKVYCDHQLGALG